VSSPAIESLTSGVGHRTHMSVTESQCTTEIAMSEEPRPETRRSQLGCGSLRQGNEPLPAVYVVVGPTGWPFRCTSSPCTAQVAARGIKAEARIRHGVMSS